MFHKEKHPERIQQLVEMIEPGLRGIDPAWSAAKQLEAAVEANVRWSVREIVCTPEAQQAFEEKRRALIVGG
jgi:carbonic anhydrase